MSEGFLDSALRDRANALRASIAASKERMRLAAKELHQSQAALKELLDLIARAYEVAGLEPPADLTTADDTVSADPSETATSSTPATPLEYGLRVLEDARPSVLPVRDIAEAAMRLGYTPPGVPVEVVAERISDALRKYVKRAGAKAQSVGHGSYRYCEPAGSDGLRERDLYRGTEEE